MTSPSMPCSNDSSGITTFTTMMMFIDQIISWIGFDWLFMARLHVLGVEVLYKCIIMLLSYFDLSSFLSKRWNRITRLKRNDHMSVMHRLSHNRSHFSTPSQKLMTIHCYYLDTKEEFDQMLYFWSSLSWFDIRSVLIFSNIRILLSINTTYLITFINRFSSLWVCLGKNASFYCSYIMLWYEYTTLIHYVWMRFHW